MPLASTDWADDGGPSRVPRRWELLNGHLTAVLPAGAQQWGEEDVPPPFAIAGGNGTHQVETRSLFVDIESGELFAVADADFEHQIREAVARWQPAVPRYRLESLSSQGPLRVLLMTPARPLPAGTSPRRMVCALFVAHPDGTVQTIELYVTRAPRAARAIALAKQIGDSLAPGPLVLPHAAGRRSVAVPGGQLEADVPDGFVAVLARRIEGTVVSFVELAPIGEDNAVVSVRLDSGPPSFPPRPGSQSARVFGRDALLGSDSSEGRQWQSGSVEIDGQFFDVDFLASSASGLAAIRRIGEGLRWVPAAGAGTHESRGNPSPQPLSPAGRGAYSY